MAGRRFAEPVWGRRRASMGDKRLLSHFVLRLTMVLVLKVLTVALVSEPTTDILLVLLVFSAKYRVQPVFLDGNNNSVQVGNRQR